VTAPGGLRTRTALAVAASAAFAVAAHAAITHGPAAPAGALLALVPLGILLLALARRSTHRWTGVALIAAGAALAWLAYPALKVNFPSLFFVEHAGGQLLLAFLFGRTLTRGEEPLVTRFARAFHGELTREVERYTRGVTLAWTVFFTSLFALSCALYLTGMLDAWSLLANILGPVLVGAMFVVEYAVRHRVLPDLEHAGLLSGVRAFSRHFAAPQSQSTR
jgi:uncharacterized membrane protein